MAIIFPIMAIIFIIMAIISNGPYEKTGSTLLLYRRNAVYLQTNKCILNFKQLDSMKKFMMLIVAAVMATAPVCAQTETKHEVGLSVGCVSNSQWLDIYEDLIGTMVGVTFHNEKFTGPFSAEYFYHPKEWIGVGGIMVFGKSTQDIVSMNHKDGELTNTYYTLMPAVKFDWLRKKYFGMYSKLGVGATLRHESADYTAQGQEDYSESAVHLNFQASLLGIEAGSQHLRGFLEAGAGEQGIFVVGLKYKF